MTEKSANIYEVVTRHQEAILQLMEAVKALTGILEELVDDVAKLKGEK
jgi:hypothetical protein